LTFVQSGFILVGCVRLRFFTYKNFSLARYRFLR
jgi:hypothetical protein